MNPTRIRRREVDSRVLFQRGTAFYFAPEPRAEHNGGMIASSFIAEAAAAAVVPCGLFDAGLIARVTTWILRLFTIVGAPAVGFGELAQSIFPPIASEVILPMAGFASAESAFSPVSAVIWALIGTMIGSSMVYFVCRAISMGRLVSICRRLPGLRVSRIIRFNERFKRHASALVVIGQFIPVVRSLVCVFAGFAKMNFLRFLLLILADSVVWDSLLLAFGHFFGTRWCLVLHMLVVCEVAILVICAIILLAALIDWLVGLSVMHGRSELGLKRARR